VSIIKSRALERFLGPKRIYGKGVILLTLPTSTDERNYLLESLSRLNRLISSCAHAMLSHAHSATFYRARASEKGPSCEAALEKKKGMVQSRAHPHRTGYKSRIRTLTKSESKATK
jgi:hypothetical protein